MPHRTFDIERDAQGAPIGTLREPITFDFGLYGEERFTVIPTPTLGDTFDLADAPEPRHANDLDACRVIARFIRSMLPVEDRPRFDAALYRIPADQAHVIIDLGAWIAERVTPFPTKPAATSSSGRQATRRTSKPKPAGSARSRR
jgi:hypothetical protein